MTRILDTSDTFSFADHAGRPCVVSFDDNVIDQEIAEYGITDQLPYIYREHIPSMKKKYKTRNADRFGINHKKQTQAFKQKKLDDMLLKEIRGY